MSQFKLGNKVTSHSILVREDYKWIPKAMPKFSGIIVGKRTIKDTEWNYDCYDDGREASLVNPKIAYLVAFDLHRKPVYILPKNLTLIEH